MRRLLRIWAVGHAGALNATFCTYHAASSHNNSEVVFVSGWLLLSQDRDGVWSFIFFRKFAMFFPLVSRAVEASYTREPSTIPEVAAAAQHVAPRRRVDKKSR